MPPSLSKTNSDTANDVGCNCDHLIALEGSSFLASGHVFLSDVPSNVVATPLPDASAISGGCFVGFDAGEPKSLHVASIGRLKNIRFSSIFRFKVWWTTHWIGRNGRDLESETQLILLENSYAGRPYVVILPILEGPFRASLQAGEDDAVELCVESGSTGVAGEKFRSVVYIQGGDDPFKLVKEAVKVVRAHFDTFKLLEEKIPPGIIDRFGWCTWDAFYLKVHPQGIWEGVKALTEGGCPPGFVIIDDGWQSTARDDEPVSDNDGLDRPSAGEQMPCRLVKFQENAKFRTYVSHKDALNKGMGAFVKDLKEEFKSIDYVYVWHALCGYWGGLRPNVPGLPDSDIVKPRLSPGLEKTMKDLAVEKMVENGVGFVSPEKVEEVFEGLHTYLESAGIDGVKVDVIQLVEMLCENYGGRVQLAKAYYKALTASVRRHFKGNGVIASMEQCNDFMFLGTEAISLGRAGDDFWSTESSGDKNGAIWLQGCHMVHCAYNSLWMGNFIHPDWDMFETNHPCAYYHAASRAISGGPIYISDSIGTHDSQLLKSLVLPDGSILRCERYALPTKDCLFEDPLHDGKTMLKIWNLNKCTGVLGAFNCQGGGWFRNVRSNLCAAEFSRSVTAMARPTDIEWNDDNYPISIENVKLFVVYFSQSKKVILLKPSDGVEISLNPFTVDLLTVSPVAVLPNKSVQFAPIGLVNMLNSGGAIQSLTFGGEVIDVTVEVKGSGELRAFTSVKPRACLLDGANVAFQYDGMTVAVQVPWPGSSRLSVIDFLF